MTEQAQEQTQVQLKDDHSTLDRIRRNALEHFSKFGYIGASVREITAASQVTKPTLYYYFENKEELYRGLATSCFTELIEALKNNVSTSGSLAAKYLSFIEAYYSFCKKDFPAARFIYVISGAPSRDVPDVGIAEFLSNITQMISAIVRDSDDTVDLPAEKQAGLKLILQALYALATERCLQGLTIPSEELQYTLTCLALPTR